MKKIRFIKTHEIFLWEVGSIREVEDNRAFLDCDVNEELASFGVTANVPVTQLISQGYAEYVEDEPELKLGEIWVPEYGEMYYSAGINIECNTTQWDSNYTDQFRLETNNVYKTPEEAKQAFKLNVAMRKLDYVYEQLMGGYEFEQGEDVWSPEVDGNNYVRFTVCNYNRRVSRWNFDMGEKAEKFLRTCEAELKLFFKIK